MGSDKEKVNVRRSNGEVEELSTDEIERINYERKVRDQMATGKRVTPKQVNIVAVLACLVGLVYAIPQIFLADNNQTSSYVPLSERDQNQDYEVLPPLPRDPDAFLDSSNALTNSTAPNTDEVISSVTETLPRDEPVKTDPIPPAEPEVAEIKPPEPNPISEINAVLGQWASDWSMQNVEDYLSHYAEGFISDTGQNLEAWKEYRYSRVLRPEWIQVELSEIEIELKTSSNAEALFVQDYKASNYSEQSKKLLLLEKNSHGWKIIKESTIN